MCVVAAGQVCDHGHRDRGREPAQPEPHPRLVWPCIPTGEGPVALLGPPNNPTEDGWWARAGCGHCRGSCSPPSPCRWPLWGLGPLQTAHPPATAALRASRSSTFLTGCLQPPQNSRGYPTGIPLPKETPSLPPQPCLKQQPEKIPQPTRGAEDELWSGAPANLPGFCCRSADEKHIHRRSQRGREQPRGSGLAGLGRFHP